jgi:hypothetical protein
MKVYEIFKNGKIQIVEAIQFIDRSNRKCIPLRLFKDGELQWTSPHFEKFTTIATRISRNEKLNLLGI